MQPTDHTETQARGEHAPELILTTSLREEAQNLVQHLAHVLDVQPHERVLLIPGDDALAGLTLAQTFDCQVTVLLNEATPVEPTDPRLSVEQGTVQALPLPDATFDAVIVVTPITSGLMAAARELARVLHRTGRLGMVAFSPYRDQIGEDASMEVAHASVMGQVRPAAAYRAVLGEAGFTAFLAEDRRRSVRQSAAAIYREHMLRDEPRDTTLSLLASGGLNVTLITAEKA